MIINPVPKEAVRHTKPQQPLLKLEWTHADEPAKSVGFSVEPDSFEHFFPEAIGTYFRSSRLSESLQSVPRKSRNFFRARLGNKRHTVDQAGFANVRNRKRIQRGTPIAKRRLPSSIVVSPKLPPNSCTIGIRVFDCPSLSPALPFAVKAVSPRVDLSGRTRYARRPSSWQERIGAEADLSAIQSEAEPKARLSSAKFDAGWSGGAEAAKGQGPQTLGCIGSPKVGLLPLAQMTLAPNNERFPKYLRLVKRSQFLRIQEHGLKVWSHPFVAMVLRNSVGVTRIGITVSKRAGNAVLRSRLRRRSRELFRKRRHLFPKGLDLLLIAQPAMKEADWAFLSRAFDQLAQKLKRSFE